MRKLPVPLLLVVLSACVSKQTFQNAKGSVKLDRRQLVEINEAFKSDAEKTITLENVGEVSCPDKRCFMPITGSGELMKEGKGAGQKPVPGILVFTREATTHLLEIVEHARAKGNEFGEKGAWGEVLCNERRCTLTFTLDNDTQVPVSTLLTPREVASEEAPAAQ